MKVQFNLIKSANQNIKISFKILKSTSNKKKFKPFSYNKESIFNYLISLNNSQIDISIHPSIKPLSQFHKNVIGSFIHDYSVKFEASQVDIDCEDQNLLDNIIIGFQQKDYIYSIYKKNSLKEKFKTSYKLKKNNSEKLKSINFLKELVSEPSNIIYPDSFVKRTEKQINKSKVNIKILDQKKIKKIGLNCLLAVSQGSARQPRVMEFSKKNKSKNVDILFVGKGVCFDTGGLDLKPAASMALMKKDMGGSANVIALAHMIMRMKLPVRLRVLIPAVENAVSGNAFRPKDILTSRKGLSVEINNTDAEGRLILADALALASEDNPDFILSMATLTGAARIAVGPDIAPFFSGSDAFSSAVASGCQDAQDPVWELPFWDPYESMIEPDIADLDNAPAGGLGGAITAALFLRRFVNEPEKYAHFDIFAWSAQNAPGRPKGGNSTGARAVFEALPKFLNL